MATPDGYTELRIDIPNEMAQLLDAVVMSKKFSKRADFCLPVLQKEIDRELHAATVLLRCARINPLASESSRNE